MKPIKLKMQAFGSYGKETEIDFTRPTQNVFLITGDTGSGKSTIFDAIVFALYGETSSESNKKSGKDLQSEFVGYNYEPYVEFTFSEIYEGETQIYTVRRVPAHMKNKRGGGLTGVKETVTLEAPGSINFDLEGNKSKTLIDEKLIDIVGLTRDQFMQIAMIAQGEFRELIRPDSRKKKEIFRKLFHTEIFDKIIKEIKSQSDSKSEIINEEMSEWRAEIRRFEIPENFAEREKSENLKELILSSRDVNISILEEFMDNIHEVCDYLEICLNDSEKKRVTLKKIYTAKLKELEKAKALTKSFEQLEESENIIRECKEKEDYIKNQNVIKEKIISAYEIKPVYERFMDSEKALNETVSKLEKQKNILPLLSEKYEQAKNAEETAKIPLDREMEVYSKVSERVSKALSDFEEINKAEKNLKIKKSLLESAENRCKKSESDTADFEAKVKRWRNTESELKDCDAFYMLWKKKKETASDIEKDISYIRNLHSCKINQQELAEHARKMFEKSVQVYSSLREDYDRKYEDFLYAQAGIIARDKLKPGEPCPVCGSYDHPCPRKLSEEHKDLTREILDELNKKVSEANDDMNDKSLKSGKAASDLKSMEDNIEKAESDLKEKISRNISDISQGNFSIDYAEAVYNEWIIKLKSEGEEIQSKSEILNYVRESLKTADSYLEKLHKLHDDAMKDLTGAKEELASAKARLESLELHKDYQNEEEANKALQEAESDKIKSEKAYNICRNNLLRTKADKENAETLINDCNEKYPLQFRDYNKRRNAYVQEMFDKNMKENEWKEITSLYTKIKAQELQNEIDLHNKKQAQAESSYNTAREAVGDNEKPIIAKLYEENEKARINSENAEKTHNELMTRYKTDSEIYERLSPKTDNFRSVIHEYVAIKDIYERLAGKTSGARMDIETYAQRYYLERILVSANRRFSMMSSGQFELRMVDEEQAGVGKNRGLDLMVYSTVTGKEREANTLSGGESFMAALSLALGMADQIQQGSSSINLDMMFIDEGFGSLDYNSRNQAVNVLKQMAYGTKLIGIISHVTELKQVLNNQLIVTKDSEGSHVRWQID